MANRSGSGLNNRVYRVEAVVMRRLSIGETDRVVTLFTRDGGKLTAVAKGARGPKSKLAGLTEPFTCFNGLLAQGQNLDVLTQGEVEHSFQQIRKDLERIGYASYFVELVDAGVTERQPLPELWDLLVAALATLETSTTPDLLARAFELNAMRVLGYEPAIYRCVVDGAPVDAGATAFHPLRGGLLCPRCAHPSGGRLVPGAVEVNAETVEAFRRLANEPFIRAAQSSIAPELRTAIGRCLIPYVRHQLDAQLRSLEFLNDVTTVL